MDVTWRKVWRDLVRNKARTILAALSTAVGVFALGLVFGLAGAMRARMTEVHREAIPAHISFWGGPFSHDIVDALRREPGVLDTEGEIDASFRWKFEGEENWREADLVAREGYDAQRMNLLHLRDGHWPARRVLGIDRLSSEHFQVLPGTAILVEHGGRERYVTIVGVVHSYRVLAPEWGGEVTFFATPETASWLTGDEYEGYFNQLHIRLESFSQESAQKTARRIQARLRRIGLSVSGYQITDPDLHWMQDMVDAVLIVLAVMGALSLGLSAFLIINTMNAIIAQQVWQIGVMKAIGATVIRVVDVYLAVALIYGGLALLLAVPLGAVGAHLLAVWLLDMLNVGTGRFHIQPVAVGIQVVVGVAVPLLAALVPILGGAHVTVREAISSHGIGSGFGRGWVDHLMGRFRCLPRLLALSLRNTFRRQGRVALTLATLTFSGAMFIMVMSAEDSLNDTFKIMFELGGDVAISLDRPHRISRLIEIAESLPGVTEVEVWGRQKAALSVAAEPAGSIGDGHNKTDGEKHPVRLRGVPPDSDMFQPRIVAGRGLSESDGMVVLVNHRLADEEGIQVGDRIALSIGEEESEWVVVGSYLSVDSISDDFFVPLEALARETGTLGKGKRVIVLSERDDVQSQQRLIKALTDAFIANRIQVTGSWSASRQWQETRAAFSVLIYLLLTMAVLTAVVGSIGLMSTMSINVVERTREIGVMRAVGGTSFAIARIFIAEGVLVGVLSWLLAVPISYPGARFLGGVIGEVVLELPLDFVYSLNGAVLWLLIVIVLSTLASLWPALRATRISLREALAYE